MLRVIFPSVSPRVIMINTKQNAWSLALSLSIAGGFIIMTTLHTLNFPAAADDFILFIAQFHEQFLTQSSFENKVSYFLSPTIGVHTKLSSRLLGLLSYELFGSVNYQFLIICGNVFYMVMAVLFALLVANRHAAHYLVPVVLSVLLVPLTLNYRPVFITGFPFHMAAVLLCFVFLTTNRIWLAYVCFVIAAFNAGGGMFSGLIATGALLLYSIYDRKNIWFALLFFVTFLAIYKFLFSFKNPSTQSTIQTDVKSVASYVTYTLIFVQNALTRYVIALKSFPWIYLTAGLGIVGVYVWLFCRRFASTIKSPFFYFSLYILLLGFLAAVVRSGGNDWFPVVAIRYEHYSAVFVVAFISLFLDAVRNGGKLLQFIIVGVFGIFFAGRLLANTVVIATGYEYFTFFSDNGDILRKYLNSPQYRYLYDFSYLDIAQNSTAEPWDTTEEAMISDRIDMARFYNSDDFTGMSFRILRQGDINDVMVVVHGASASIKYDVVKARPNRYYWILGQVGQANSVAGDVYVYFRLDGNLHKQKVGLTGSSGT